MAENTESKKPMTPHTVGSRRSSKAAAVAVDPAQTREVQQLGHGQPLLACRIDPEGRFAVCGAQDNLVGQWELATGNKVDLAGHKSWVRGMAFQPRSRCLFTGDYAGQVNRWLCGEAEAVSPTATFQAHEGWVRTVSFSHDGQVLATGGNDNRVRLWSAADGQLRRELDGHACHVYNTAFHPDGQHFVSADLKGVVKHWELSTGRLLRDLDAGVLHKYDGGFRADCGGVRGMAFSPDGRYLACTGITEVTNAFAGVGKPAVVVFDWLTGQRKEVLKPKSGQQGIAWGVAFHPNGFVIGVLGGRSGGELCFWHPTEPEPFFSMKLPRAGRDLDLHPDGRRMAVALFDGTLRIYDMSPKAEG